MSSSQVVPDRVKWTDIEDLNELDNRVSAVGYLYPDLIDVKKVYITWCPANDADEDHYFAWVWTIRPSQAAVIKSCCGDDLKALIEEYETGDVVLDYALTNEDFIRLSEVAATTDTSTLTSARTKKAAITALWEIVTLYADNERLDELFTLMGHATAGSWVAFFAPEQPDVTEAQLKACRKKIKSIAHGSTDEAKGAREWLRETDDYFKQKKWWQFWRKF